MLPSEGKTSNQRCELLKSGLRFWETLSWRASALDSHLEGTGNLISLASWDFPERTQTNESSHTQTGLCSSVHCYFIQIVLQSPVFEVSKSNVISCNDIPKCPATEIGFCILFSLDSFSISLLTSHFLSKEDSILIDSWA